MLLDYSSQGGFSSRPHHALRCSYFEAINLAGGLPVGLPYLSEAIGDYLDYIDGLLVPGGFYSFPSNLYGQAQHGDEIIHPRYAFENALTLSALQCDMPVLGICAGMQVLAAARGALLHKSIDRELHTLYDHLNERPAEEPAHPIKIEHGTQLHTILGVEHLDVNTAHNEALKTVPETIMVSAWAPDGIIEGIECLDQQFAIGVQWHPEFFIEREGPNLKLFRAFLSACQKGTVT